MRYDTFTQYFTTLYNQQSLCFYCFNKPDKYEKQEKKLKAKNNP